MHEIRQLKRGLRGNVLHSIQEKLRVEQKKREAVKENLSLHIRNIALGSKNVGTVVTTNKEKEKRIWQQMVVLRR
jgi:hypothetical protein